MSTNFFIPPLGSRLVLAQPWDFQLFNERRNVTLMAMLGDDRPVAYRDPEAIPSMLPAGTELIIDRYYIRSGLAGFDSVSFRIVGAKAAASAYPMPNVSKTVRQVRFWAKLDDVNKMVVDFVAAQPGAKT